MKISKLKNNIQWMSYLTILKKEIARIIRIWPRTLIPSIITTVLYFLIFGKVIGSQISNINGVSYMDFIIPGLVLMPVITNAFSQTVFSFFLMKWQRSIEEILVSPTKNFVIIFGFVSGGIIRGMINGLLVLMVAMLFSDNLAIKNFTIIFITMFLTSAIFSLLGFLNALFGKTFDDLEGFSSFVLTPMIYLGGVFYNIQNLPEPWLSISLLNPIVYMINSLRYGFYDIDFINIKLLYCIMICFVITLFLLACKLFSKKIRT